MLNERDLIFVLISLLIKITFNFLLTQSSFTTHFYATFNV